MTMKKERCVICEELIKDIYDSNNPWPIRDHGACCRICNDTKVVPARIAEAMAQPLSDDSIITCSGIKGHCSGNYHYWYSAGLSNWVGVRVDSNGKADGDLFFGFNRVSIENTIKLFNEHDNSNVA